MRKIIMSKTKNDLAIIILAAGQGSRMKSDLPKVLHKIAGKEMIRYVIDTAKSMNPKHLIVVISKGQPKIIELLSNNEIDYAIQEKQLGTGDAVRSALSKLKGFKGNILVMYGDTPFIEASTLEFMLENMREKKTSVSVLGFVANDPTGYGRLIIDNKGRLTAIIEEREASQDQKMIDLCNAGIMAFTSDVLSLLEKLDNKNSGKEFYLTDIVKIANNQKLSCAASLASEDEVMGINNRVDLASAEVLMQGVLNLRALDNGVTMISPETVHLSYDTVIDKGVTIEPYVVIGIGVKIGRGAHIRSFSYIEGAEIGDGVIVGPFARLRKGTKLGKNSRIGNFVEVKESDIGEDAKINHLSYVGDSSVGKKANIGAGTITCNYDGKKKHKTKIGEGAFIGSNTSLVAPIKIGKDAVIGAGSTILKDVESNSLAINKMLQINKKNRARGLRKK